MSADVVKVDAIRVEDRARREYTGIDTLAASIDSLGLLHPIVVTPDLRLVTGGRRLEAVRALGWESVDVTIAANLTEAADLLRAESDENTERVPLRPTEAADLARKIEEALAPLAAERVGGRPSKTAGNLPGVSEPRPRDVAAKATGVSATTIRKVRLVQEVVESESTPEAVRAVAKAALVSIDATGKVDAGHKAVRVALTAAEAVAEFPDLAYYFDKGDHDTAAKLGNALRGYAEPELSMRLNNLRLTVEAERRKDGELTRDEGPDYAALADAMVVAINNALQVASKNGGADTIREAMPSANPIAVDVWRCQFERIHDLAADLLAATRPVLRSVK